jgi:hypothetical protein
MLALVVAWFWFLLVVGLLGLYRLLRARRELDEDWRPMAQFGGALHAYTKARGHDDDAYATMVTLADRMRAQTGAGRPAQSGHDPFDLLADLPATMAREAAADEPGKDALAALRGRIHGYESLLQSEMKTLGRGMTHPGQWLAAGVRGVLLLPGGLALGGDVVARARRRDLEADPRFERASWIALAVLAGITLVLAAWLALHAAEAWRALG